jgi:hypothetical protein
MKTHDTTSDNDYKSRAAANDLKQKTDAEKVGLASAGPSARRNHTDMINASPYMISQRKRLHGLSGQPLQKQEDLEDEELLQGKSAAQMQPEEDEELLQGKSAVQMQPEEDEELLQGKSAAQMQPEEDEELLQGKSAVQMQPEEDEELLQGKFGAQMQPEEEEELQGKFAAQRQPLEDEELMQGKLTAQMQPDENRTGMPDELKANMESKLNTDFSQVRIHPNSSKATEVGALAYTQGTDVHFAPGQFKPESSNGQQLLGHELTHVVQQGQGRVQPTGKVAGLPVNDSPALENEADELGKKIFK